MKFEKGIWYSFLIIGITNVPDKGDYFILLHESGRKMLLNTEYYVKYNFMIGQTIQCRVDKVNCTGQIFLEPKHPHYEEGANYPFNLIGSSTNEDNTVSLIVRDLYENPIQVIVNSEMPELLDTPIELKVERVKKGIPILSYYNAANSLNYPIIPETITLRVAAIVDYNSELYYSLAEGDKIVSRLKVKHYNHYGLKIGNTIHCISRGYDSTGLILVEPENPWYNIGESYKFEVKNFEEYVDLGGEKVRIAVVLDVNANKCSVSVDEINPKQLENLQEIKCKVLGFRKGRPQLEADLF